MGTSSLDSGSRQRNAPQTSNGSSTPLKMKHINTFNAEDFEPPRTPWSIGKIIGVGAAWIHMTVPPYLNWAIIIGLIFGGCCSNVFALETIIQEERGSGLLITFVQFVVVALLALPTHFSIVRPPFFLKPRNVPLVRLLPYTLMFFAVNLLNNFAFGYNISVPVHIILRSGGSIMTMLVGYVWGNRYTGVQISSVAMLTVGVVMAAWADAQSKGKTSSGLPFKFDPQLITGLVILFVAQLLSAIMGLYTQLTYAKYGSHWHEYMFYSHFLSIPLFAPFFPSLLSQLRQLVSSTSVELTALMKQPTLLLPKAGEITQDGQLPPILLAPSILNVTIPKHMVNLVLNALTQYVCIRGVNILAARTSAVGVTIALNVRKLVSLFASIWLFGNNLPLGVSVGAVAVFGSAGIWTWEGQRIASRERDEARKKQ